MKPMFGEDRHTIMARVAFHARATGKIIYFLIQQHLRPKPGARCIRHLKP
jgi:hypothetical protein